MQVARADSDGAANSSNPRHRGLHQDQQAFLPHNNNDGEKSRLRPKVSQASNSSGGSAASSHDEQQQQHQQQHHHGGSGERLEAGGGSGRGSSLWNSPTLRRVFGPLKQSLSVSAENLPRARSPLPTLPWSLRQATQMSKCQSID